MYYKVIESFGPNDPRWEEFVDNISTGRLSLNRVKIITIAWIAGIIVCFSLAATDELSLPFEDDGACPFECCTYRQWTVAENTRIYKTRDDKSQVVFTANKGDAVKGVTGIVVTIRPGRALIKKSVALGLDDPVTIPAGETLQVLHYEGEGFSKFWFRGKTYSDEIPFPDEETDSIKTLNGPETVWWVQIENAKGQSGWSKETEHFDHMDACE